MYKPVNVGEQIKYYRSLRGLSQEALALEAGINPAFLGHLERNLKSPTVTTLEKIAMALDIPLSELFTHPLHAAQPDDMKQTAIEQVVFRIKDLPTDSIRRIIVILQNIFEIEK